jgi:hypothetical protein
MTATAIGSYATASTLKTRLGITDSTDDTVLGLVCDQVNDFIEGRTQRVLAPISSATYYYDGDDTRKLFLPRTARGDFIGGIRAITTVSVQAYTGAGYEDLASSQYFLRGIAGVRGPFEWLYFTDYPTGTYSYWPKGYETVKIVATAGWAAIPDEITDLALTAATRTWFGVKNGEQDIVGTDAFGRPLVSRYFSPRDLETLRRYSLDLVG